MFHSNPALYYNNSKVENFNLSRYVIYVFEPVDNRSQFIGEEIYRNKKVQPLEDFFQSPTMIEIQHKITSDLNSFGMYYTNDSTKNKISITTNVEVFYPDVRGFIWAKSFAKVRLLMTAKSKGIILISKKYESFDDYDN